MLSGEHVYRIHDLPGMKTEPRPEYELDLVVQRKETIADGAVRLTLGHPGGQPLPAREPGAHLDLVLTPDLTRQYSLCGDPHDQSVLQVAVLREEAGRGGSQYVHDALTEGQAVHVRGPRNHFPLVPSKHYLFTAGGIGITPILPAIAQVAGSGCSWKLVYGGRARASMAFRDELEARYPGHVEIHPQDERGLLDLPALLADPGGSLHVERFAPKAGADDGPREAFEVELAQTGTVLEVPGHRSMLDVIEESGVAVLSSCQEGTCGTCETTVLSGKPDHRDSILTDEEREAGDTMLICVSRSCSPRLVLDL